MQKKRLIIALGVLIALAAAFFVIWRFYAPSAKPGDKTITVEVTHFDGTVRDFSLSTDAETLWDAMAEKDLIEGEDGEYGKWVTAVDGETADASAGQYWMFTKGGEWVDTSCDTTYIADGEGYEFFIYVS